MWVFLLAVRVVIHSTGWKSTTTIQTVKQVSTVDPYKYKYKYNNGYILDIYWSDEEFNDLRNLLLYVQYSLGTAAL